MSGDKSEETGLMLVANLIGELQKQVLAISPAVSSLQGRLDMQSAKLDLIHAEVRKTNGRVTEIETWRDGMQDESDQAHAYAAGVEKRKADERKVANSLWRSARPYVLMATGALVGWAGHELGVVLLGWWR